MENKKKEQRELFNTIYTKYKDLIYYIVIKIVREKNLARKLTMQAIEKLSQTVPAYSINKSVISVARDIAISSYKGSSDEEFKVEEIEKIENNPIGDFDSLLDKYFNGTDKNIIILHVVFSYTFRETSELLSIPLKDVRARYKESQNKLKLVLKEIGK